MSEPVAPRRRVGWFMALGALVLVLAFALVVADVAARGWATGFVRDRVVSVLGLPADAPVEVELSGGSMLWQALLGRVDEVRVGVDGFAVGEVVGDAELVARGVPLDPSRAVDSLEIRVRVDEAEVRKLAAYFTGLETQEIALRDGFIHVGSELQVLFLTIPVSMDLAPAAVEGGISFDPQVIAVGGQEFTVADLRASPQFSAIAGTLLAARDFCFADRIPAALSVRDAAVVDAELVVTLSAGGIALNDPAFASTGVCPSS